MTEILIQMNRTILPDSGAIRCRVFNVSVFSVLLWKENANYDKLQNKTYSCVIEKCRFGCQDSYDQTKSRGGKTNAGLHNESISGRMKTMMGAMKIRNTFCCCIWERMNGEHDEKRFGFSGC